MDQSFYASWRFHRKKVVMSQNSEEEIRCMSRMFVCLTYKENKTKFVFSDYFLILMLNFVCKGGIN